MDTTNLIAWLPFDDSTTEDLCGNTWTATGNPTIEKKNAIVGSALQLDGQSYLKLSNIMLGGQDFEISGWVYVDSSSPNYARVLNIVNPDNGWSLVSVRKSPNDATKLDFWANSYADVSQDWGHYFTSSINSVGERVHLKLIYRYSDKRLSFCINDVIAADWTAATQYNRRAFDIYIGNNTALTQGVIGSVDELLIYDGVWHTYNYSNTPTADDYIAMRLALLGEIDVSFDVDLRRTIVNPAISYRYENAGDAGDLLTSNNISTDLPANKSKFGVAFTQGTAAKCFPINDSYELWAKFDVYINNGEVWCAYNDGAAGICGIKTFQGLGFLDMWQNGRDSYVTGVFSTFTARNTVLLHMLSGTTDGVIEVWVNGKYIKKVTGDVNNGNAFDNFYLQSGSSRILFSNVIISDSEIGLDEDCKRAMLVDFTADLRRNVIRTENFTVDLQRTLIVPLKIYIKPEVFMTWIPRGEINFKPEIFATLIDAGVPCEFNADLRRNVTRTETFSADMRRKLTNSETADFDLCRTLVTGETFSFDLRRSVINSVNFSFDLQRKIINRVEFSADLKRTITSPNEFTVDLRRTLVNSVDFTFDLRAHVFWQWLTRILPESSFLDPKIYASAEALDAQITAFHLAIREVLHLPRLDELSGTILDLLAEQFHVDAYDAINFSDEEKRNLIRQSIAWHRIKGTPAAVHMVLQDAFKDLHIDEWFNYGGEPYYFRLWTKGYKSTPERFKSFWLMFMDAKNVRSHLEKIIIDDSHEDPIKIYAGVAKVLSGLKITGLPKPKDKKIQIYTGVAKVETGKKIIGLLKPKNLSTKIYSGAYKICTGTIFTGMKYNPF